VFNYACRVLCERDGPDGVRAGEGRVSVSAVGLHLEQPPDDLHQPLDISVHGSQTEAGVIHMVTNEQGTYTW